MSAQKQTSLFGNLLLNILIPTLILTKLSTDEWLGPTWAVVAALAFPLGYGLYEALLMEWTPPSKPTVSVPD